MFFPILVAFNSSGSGGLVVLSSDTHVNKVTAPLLHSVMLLTSFYCLVISLQ